MMKKILLVIANILIALGLTACQKPYHLALNNINETDPQAPATILLSHPQVMSRQTLINDRRTEVEYLENYLAKVTIPTTETIQFGPQIKRDLRVLTSMAASLGISFDPAAGAAFERADQQDELRHQINVSKLEARLHLLEEELKQLRTPEESSDTVINNNVTTGEPRVDGEDPVNEDSVANTLPKPNTPVTPQSFEEMRTKLGKIETLINAVQTSLNTEAAKNSPAVNTSKSELMPQDEFEDRQALRAKIRSKRSAMDLDDTHDIDGNTLLRMQFQATVLPGKIKDKFGAVTVDLEKAELSSTESSDLYFKWLAHINYRLNTVKDGKLVPNEQAELLSGSGLYEVIHFALGKGDGKSDCDFKSIDNAYMIRNDPDRKDCDILSMALPPGAASRHMELEPFITQDDKALGLVSSVLREWNYNQGAVFSGKGVDAKKINALGKYFEMKPDTTTTPPAKPAEPEVEQEQSIPEKSTGLLNQFLSILTQAPPEPTQNKTPAPKPEKNKTDKPDSKKTDQKNSECKFKPMISSDFLNTLKEVKVFNNPRIRAAMRTTPFMDSEISSLDRNGLTNRWMKTETNKSSISESSFFTPEQAYEYSREILKSAPAFAAVLSGLSNIHNLPSHIRSEVDYRFRRFTETSRWAHIYLNSISARNKDCLFKLPGDVILEGKEESSKAFAKILDDQKDKIRTFVYQITPFEMAQQISTLASAANSLQLALAASGAIPGQGIGIDASAAYSQTAVGKISAIERIPLVMGFSRAVSSSNTNPQFGWVFGPKVRVDPEKKELVLEQANKPYDVSVDISVPGWWPKITLNAKMGWVHNWHNEKVQHEVLEALPSPNEKKIFVSQEPNRGDLDGLTDLLAKLTIGRGPQQARIVDLEPEFVSACSTTSEFLIYGPNLWRGTEVFLSGVRGTSPSSSNPTRISAESVRILPSMEGVVAKFSTNNTTAQFSDHVKLTIATRNGLDSRSVRVIPQKNGTCVAHPTLTDPTLPFITSFAPKRVSNCAKDSIFVFQGKNLKTLPSQNAYLGSWIGETEEKKKDELVKITFNNNKPFGLPDGSTREITLVTEKGLISQTITFIGHPNQCKDRKISNITTISPTEIATCKKPVVITANGENLFDKGATVKLGTATGRVETTDQEGKKARFIFDQPAKVVANQNLELQYISANNDIQTKVIKFVKDEVQCPVAKVPAPKTNKTSIIKSISPTQVLTCDGKIEITANGENLFSKPPAKVALGHLKGRIEPIDKEGKQVRFVFNKRLKQTPQTIRLHYTSPTYEIQSQVVKITGDPSKCTPPTPPSIKPTIDQFGPNQVNTCKNAITIFAYGTNLVANTEAVLGTLSGKVSLIGNDKKGIKVKFATEDNKKFGFSPGPVPFSLIVPEHGLAQKNLTSIGNPNKCK
jgi:hypothetical protein